jgi:hypothetical protein
MGGRNHRARAQPLLNLVRLDNPAEVAATTETVGTVILLCRMRLGASALITRLGRTARGRRREYELSKRVSLVRLDPGAFEALKSTGRCDVELPEELFDTDSVGHFFRRLKSVGMTIADVTGPYTSINCTLTLLSSKVRTRSDSASLYREQPPDPRFRYDFVVVQSMATITGRKDSGLFELNFGDERYLPFEGLGAISRWRIDLPKDSNAFDFEAISDIVLKLDYTAREGGEQLRKAAGTCPPPCC